jgi:hypothetical protein
MKNKTNIDPGMLFEGLCPYCGSDRCRVSKTMKPIRICYCQDCHKDWRSITTNLLCDDALMIVAEIMAKKTELMMKYPFL